MHPTIKLVHISDLHVGRHDESVLASLKTLLEEQKPKYLIVTGDLANHSYINTIQSIRVLRDLVEGLNPEPNVLVVPGNHDDYFYGVFGCKWPISWMAAFIFKLYFKGYGAKKVFISSCDYFFQGGRDNRYFVSLDDELAFFLFDSNPLFSVKEACGRISNNQLECFKEAHSEFISRYGDRYKKCLKVALVHHHIVPIPYSETLESFLVLKNAGEFLRILAQCGIDIAMHGHKHCSVTSYLELGTVHSGIKPLSIIACGSTSKSTEAQFYCNVLEYYRDGILTIMKGEAAPGNAFNLDSPRPIPHLEAFVRNQNTLSRKAMGYEQEGRFNEYKIDNEGDAYSVTKVMNLRPTKSTGFKPVPDSGGWVDAGFIHRPRLKFLGGSRELEFHGQQPCSGVKRAIFKFKGWDHPCVDLDLPVKFEYSHWELNSQAIYIEEYRRKYGSQSGTTPSESFFATVNRATKCLQVEIDLPECWPADFEPVVHLYYYRPSDVEHKYPIEPIQTLYKPQLHLKKRKLLLRISNPILGTYRIQWTLPNLKSTGTDPLLLGETDRFLLALTALRQVGQSNPQVQRFFSLMRTFEQALRERLILEEDLEVSLMIPETDTATGKRRLVIIADNHGGNVESKWNTHPDIDSGDGTAGRAFKLGEPRVYVKAEADSSEKPNAYLPVGNRFHEVLYSIPLAHPSDPMLDKEAPKSVLICVINVGSYVQGSKLLPLPTRDVKSVVKVLEELGYAYLLPRLMQMTVTELTLPPNWLKVQEP